MSNFSSIIVNSAPDAETMAALERQAKEASGAIGPNPSGQSGSGIQTPNTGGMAHQSITYDGSGNVAKIEQHGVKRVEIPTPLAAGLINIPGVGITSIAAAKAAGFITDAPSSFKDATGKPTQVAQTKAESDKPETDTPVAAEITAASEILQRVSGVIGGDAVLSEIERVADTGEIPTTLPEGMTPAEADSVVVGYTLQAEATLKGVNASVALLSEMLTDKELTAARRAVVLQDSEQVRGLGAEALNRLAMLPTKSPDRWTDLIGTLPPDERKALRQDANGTWIVDLGDRTTTFANAVRSGRVRMVAG